MRTLGVLHDGPTDLRTPGALVRSIQRSHQVVLPQGPVRGTLITRHVSCQGSIGYVDTSMRACVYDCGKVDLGRVVGSYPADSFDWPIAGNVDRCRTSSFSEDLVREDSARRRDGSSALDNEGRMQLCQRARKPRHCVLGVDPLTDGSARHRSDVAMRMVTGPAGGPSRLRSSDTALRVRPRLFSSRLRCAAMMALRVEPSGAASSCLISFSGICNSRKRLIICACGIWLVR